MASNALRGAQESCFRTCRECKLAAAQLAMRVTNLSKNSNSQEYLMSRNRIPKLSYDITRHNIQKTTLTVENKSIIYAHKFISGIIVHILPRLNGNIPPYCSAT